MKTNTRFRIVCLRNEVEPAVIVHQPSFIISQRSVETENKRKVQFPPSLVYLSARIQDQNHEKSRNITETNSNAIRGFDSQASIIICSEHTAKEDKDKDALT
jgi:hypothetical protein